jgi:hypothetical protein
MQVLDRERANGPYVVSNLNVEAALTKLNQGYQPQLSHSNKDLAYNTRNKTSPAASAMHVSPLLETKNK